MNDSNFNNILINKINEIPKLETPKYYYIKDIIFYFCNSIKDMINELDFANIKLYYALKANNNPEVIKFLSGLVDGFEISSSFEYNLLKKHFNIQDIDLFANGTSYSNSDIEEIIKSKKKFNFNSLSQLKKHLNEQNTSISIRLNVPSSETIDYNSRFGFTNEDLIGVKNFKNNVTSLTLSSGLKNLNNLKKEISAIKKIIDVHELLNVRTINFGGGWDDLFFKNEMSEALNLISNEFKEYTLIIEPGSLLVRNSGVLLSKAIEKREINKKTFLSMDCSLFNISSWYSPKLLAVYSDKKRESNEELKSYIICGNTCYEDDFLNFKFKEILEGDICVFYPVGAYYKTTERNLHGQNNIKEEII